MNIERHVQQRSMFGALTTAPAGVNDAKISGIAPGCSSGVSSVTGCPNCVSAFASVYRLRWSGPVRP
jgi:hypothetical protein